jgi:hypothetical protein
MDEQRRYDDCLICSERSGWCVSAWNVQLSLACCISGGQSSSKHPPAFASRLDFDHRTRTGREAQDAVSMMLEKGVSF